MEIKKSSTFLVHFHILWIAPKEDWHFNNLHKYLSSDITPEFTSTALLISIQCGWFNWTSYFKLPYCYRLRATYPSIHTTMSVSQFRVGLSILHLNWTSYPNFTIIIFMLKTIMDNKTWFIEVTVPSGLKFQYDFWSKKEEKKNTLNLKQPTYCFRIIYFYLWRSNIKYELWNEVHLKKEMEIKQRYSCCISLKQENKKKINKF